MNTNNNFDLIGYKMVIFLQIFLKLFLNHSGMVLALSKGPEAPKKLVKKCVHVFYDFKASFLPGGPTHVER